MMNLNRGKEERLVAIDRPADRAAKLVADQVIAQAVVIRKPVLRRQRLDTVVFKQRSVEAVGPALQYSVRRKSTCSSVLGGWVVRNHSIFLDRIRRDARHRSARAVGKASAAQTLVVVVHPF